MRFFAKSVSIASAFLLAAAGICLGAAAPKTAAPPADKSSGELLRDPENKGPTKFTTPTKEENEDAIASAKRFGTKVADKLELKLATMETRHFLIFTDWDAREHAFLQNNVEQAYNAVARTLEQPTSGSVFPGKLPIFMLAEKKTFDTFAKEISGFDSKTLLGYYMPVASGYGYMAMWKPDVKKAKGDVKAAEKDWATTLTHEFTHAFIARYKSDARLPTWLGEGVAEVVSYRAFPRPWIYQFVRDRAKQKPTLDYLFEAKKLVGDDYPVAQTVAETLIALDSRAFLKMLNDIKDGMTAADALKKEYKKDLHELDLAWRKYIQTVK